MREIIQVGESLRVYLPYFDITTGDPVDPLSLVCTMEQPDGNIVTVTYPESDFVKVAAGEYFVRLSGVQVGTHRYSVSAQINANDVDIRGDRFDVESAL